jgi:hypothetical protein
MSSESYRYSTHLNHVLAVTRPQIQRRWIAATIEEPDWTEEQSRGVVRYFRRIAEFEGRVLRVVVNHNSFPPIIVTAFFDRRAAS